MKKNKLFIVDVDGFTTGHKFYGPDGMPTIKTFYDKDFTALKELSAEGYEIIWLSGDEFINRNVAKNRNYKFVSAVAKAKQRCFFKLSKIAFQTKKIISVGDDMFDLELIELVDRFYIPSNSHWRLLRASEKNTNIVKLNTVGNGVIEEISSIELLNTSDDNVFKGVKKLMN